MCKGRWKWGWERERRERGGERRGNRKKEGEVILKKESVERLGGRLECSDQEAVKKAPYKKIEIDWWTKEGGKKKRNSIRWKRSRLTLRGQHRRTVTYPPRRNTPTIYIYTYSFTVVQEQGFLSKRIGDYKNNFLILVINVSSHYNVQATTTATIMIK